MSPLDERALLRRTQGFVAALLVQVIVFVGGNAYAVPALPVMRQMTQPDGTAFTVRQWGDENRHGFETEAGDTILFDEKSQAWVYAVEGAGGGLASSGLAVGANPPPPESRQLRPIPPSADSPEYRAPTRMKALARDEDPSLVRRAAVPSTGVGKIPVILVTFPDTLPTYSPMQFYDLLFGRDTNSLSDYYREVSYGTFDVSAGSSKKVFGWFTASKPHDYYGANDGAGNDRWPGDLAYEAVRQAAEAGVNFAEYDTNGDCYVDMVAIVHSGSGEDAGGSSTDIWAHSWSLSEAKSAGYSHYGAYDTGTVCPSDHSKKIMVDDYTMQAERFPGAMGMQTIGVFAHEYGHALGLPDLYDTDGTSQGVGNWSLMGDGLWNSVGSEGEFPLVGNRPAHLDAWCKYKLGWTKPKQVSGTLSNVSLRAASAAPDVYQFLSGSPAKGEYFLVENRQKSGFDAGLPGSGLLIWHVDAAVGNNTKECWPGGPYSCSSRHYKVALVQADGRNELDENINRGDNGDPFPGSAAVTSFDDVSSPASTLYGGKASGVSVGDISQPGPVMTATLSASGRAEAASAYTISAAATTGGTISPVGEVTVDKGKSRSFTIVPDAGYRLVNVTVDSRAVGSKSKYTFSNIKGDHAISASFDLITYPVTLKPGKGGGIFPTGVSIQHGGAASFTVYSYSGYTIGSVSLDGKKVQGPYGDIYTLPLTDVTAKHTLSAGFTKKKSQKDGVRRDP